MRSILFALGLVTSFLTTAPSDLRDRITVFLDALTPAHRQLPTKAGCEMDPSGRCLSATQVKAGCEMDPDGRCRTGS